MSRIRFATVRALFESFPEALRNIGAAPTDERPKRLQICIAEGIRLAETGA